MSQPERSPEQLVRMVDALLEELARQATDSKTIPNQFFSQLGDTYHSVVQPTGFALLSFGPEGESFLIYERNSESFPYAQIAIGFVGQSGVSQG